MSITAEGLARLRSAKVNGTLVNIVRDSLLETLGEPAQNALHDAQCLRTMQAYAESFLTLAEAVVAFNMDAEIADALSVAASGYAQAKRALDAQLECVVRDMLGSTEH